MRRLLRTAAAAAAIGLAAAPAAPAHAVPAHAVPAQGLLPGPRADQWWFRSWSIQKEVWPLTKGKGVTVAVIDTGVNGDLPDLRPVVLPGTDLTGNGGDGRRDYDTHKHGHGTGMASLIASQGTATGFVGIAPEAKILPIAAPAVNGPTTAKAIRFAVDHGATVVNISESSVSAALYPNQCPPQILDAVKYAADNDVVVVASAGNTGDVDNKPNYPASCPGVLAVGAFGQDGKPWRSTQRQPYVTVAAPGTGVGWINMDGHAYRDGQGTSQAGALTSGAVALIRSRYPQMPARQVVQRITATAKDFGPPGKDDQLGYGVVSIPRALTQNVPDTAPNPVYERLDKASADTTAGPKAGAATKSAAAEKDDSGGFPLLIVGGAVGVLLVLGAGGLLLMLLMRGRAPAAAPSGAVQVPPFATGPGPLPGPPPGGPHHRPPGR